jgi:hypothetical protein
MTLSVGEGFLYDVTVAGAFIATNMVVDRGEKVELEFNVPGADGPQMLPAVVARCAAPTQNHKGRVPAGLGVAFKAATPQDFKLINQIVVTTLTLDLLDFGYEKPKDPTDTDTRDLNGRKHPIPWQMPGSEDANRPLSSSSTIRLHVSDLLREFNAGDADLFSSN